MERVIYRSIMALLVVILSIVIGIGSWISVQRVGDIYIKETERTITEVKQSFLKNTVDNLIVEIDLLRELENEYYKQIVDSRSETLLHERALTEEEFKDYFISRFTYEARHKDAYDYWTVLLWNHENEEVLYDPEGLMKDDLIPSLLDVDASLAQYLTISKGAYTGLFGVSKEYIEESVKSKIAKKIRGLKFDDDSYIWVNEILDYAGGDNYAIRVVHPNLPETEGSYLSTDLEDVKGNTPYLTELEGIRTEGELFFNYYFEELNSDEISEKMSFAKLYLDYNWVIGMGVHVDDLQQYVAETSSKSNKLVLTFLADLIPAIICLTVFFFAFAILIEKLYIKRMKRRLQLERDHDALTGAWNRQVGETILVNAYKDFKETRLSLGIMVFDVDNFKAINDKYGHSVGDQVLQNIVHAVQGCLRSADAIIRWSGDEFVVSFPGLDFENVESHSQRILDSVNELEFEVNGEKLELTISQGITFFKPEDDSYKDALRRAVKAMYEAKEAGRNRYKIS